MKNFEKYITEEERARGFKIFCGKREECAVCEMFNMSKPCRTSWLKLEYEDELEICPFCGGKAEFFEEDEKISVKCTECECVLKCLCDTKDKAIDQWNERVRKI